MNISDVLVINLDKRTDRWIHFLDESKNSTIISNNAKRVSAIDGSFLSDQEIAHFVSKQAYKDITTNRTTKGLYLSRGGVGLSITYYKILQNCVGPTILLEDDIVISKQFDQVFKSAYSELPNDWDILYLGWYDSSNLKLDKVSTNINRISGQINGTNGWVINPTSAQKILKIFPLKYQIDTELYLHQNLNKYCTNQKIIRRALIYKNDSNIQI